MASIPYQPPRPVHVPSSHQAEADRTNATCRQRQPTCRLSTLDYGLASSCRRQTPPSAASTVGQADNRVFPAYTSGLRPDVPAHEINDRKTTMNASRSRQEVVAKRKRIPPPLAAPTETLGTAAQMAQPVAVTQMDVAVEQPMAFPGQISRHATKILRQQMRESTLRLPELIESRQAFHSELGSSTPSHNTTECPPQLVASQRQTMVNGNTPIMPINKHTNNEGLNQLYLNQSPIVDVNMLPCSTKRSCVQVDKNSTEDTAYDTTPMPFEKRLHRPTNGSFQDGTTTFEHSRRIVTDTCQNRNMSSLRRSQQVHSSQRHTAGAYCSSKLSHARNGRRLSQQCSATVSTQNRTMALPNMLSSAAVSEFSDPTAFSRESTATVQQSAETSVESAQPVKITQTQPPKQRVLERLEDEIRYKPIESTFCQTITESQQTPLRNRVVAVDKRFNCNICGKRFVQADVLKLHTEFRNCQPVAASSDSAGIMTNHCTDDAPDASNGQGGNLLPTDVDLPSGQTPPNVGQPPLLQMKPGSPRKPALGHDLLALVPPPLLMKPKSPTKPIMLTVLASQLTPVTWVLRRKTTVLRLPSVSEDIDEQLPSLTATPTATTSEPSPVSGLPTESQNSPTTSVSSHAASIHLTTSNTASQTMSDSTPSIASHLAEGPETMSHLPPDSLHDASSFPTASAVSSQTTPVANLVPEAPVSPTPHLSTRTTPSGPPIPAAPSPPSSSAFPNRTAAMPEGTAEGHTAMGFDQLTLSTFDEHFARERLKMGITLTTASASLPSGAMVEVEAAHADRGSTAFTGDIDSGQQAASRETENAGTADSLRQTAVIQREAGAKTTRVLPDSSCDRQRIKDTRHDRHGNVVEHTQNDDTPDVPVDLAPEDIGCFPASGIVQSDVVCPEIVSSYSGIHSGREFSIRLTSSSTDTEVVIDGQVERRSKPYSDIVSDRTQALESHYLQVVEDARSVSEAVVDFRRFTNQPVGIRDIICNETQALESRYVQVVDDARSAAETVVDFSRFTKKPVGIHNEARAYVSNDRRRANGAAEPYDGGRRVPMGELLWGFVADDRPTPADFTVTVRHTRSTQTRAPVVALKH